MRATRGSFKVADFTATAIVAFGDDGIVVRLATHDATAEPTPRVVGGVLGNTGANVVVGGVVGSLGSFDDA